MNNIDLENNLIIPDIADRMQDYVPVQLDIDETKVKAAAYIAQTVDLLRVITQANLDRVKNPQNSEDDALKEAIIPALCFFTHSRCLKMFNGTLTDSGYIVSEDAERAVKIAKEDADESYSVAEVFLTKVLDILDGESETDVNIDRSVMTPKIRVFGGAECKGSN